MFIRAWILMLILGAIYHATNWHWTGSNGHTVILALGYWWCLLIIIIFDLVTD